MDLPDRVATGIALLWSAVAVVVVTVTFALTAHGNMEQQTAATPTMVAVTSTPGPSTTPAPSRPPGVPAIAVLVTEDTVLAPDPPGGPRLFFWLTCDGPLLTIATTRETIYAQVDCVRYWLVHEVIRPYQGQPVRITITTGPNATLVMDAESAGAARFEVGAVWVDPR